MDFKPIIEKNLQVLMNKYKKSKERFKANAYQRAYNALPDNVYTVDDVKDVGGAKTFEKLKFMIENNKDLPEVEEYMNDGSHAIIEQLQTVYGIGPAKATKLYNQHNVRSLEDLKTKTDLLDDKQMLGLQYYDDILARIPYKEMEKHDDFVQSEVAKMMHNKNITDENLKYAIVGSYRRKLKDSGDIDILLTGEQNYLGILITTLIEKGYIVGTAVLARGDVKFMGLCKLPRHKRYRRIDILYTPSHEYPFAELYFTGSNQFNIRMRAHAAKLGYTLNEQGLLNTNTKDAVSEEFVSEKDIFDFLKFEYLEPEYRK